MKHILLMFLSATLAATQRRPADILLLARSRLAATAAGTTLTLSRAAPLLFPYNTHVAVIDIDAQKVVGDIP